MSAAGTPGRSRACRAATAPSSMADRSFSVPPNVPNPVRTPDRNTTSLWEPWVFMGEAPRLCLQIAEYGCAGRGTVGQEVAGVRRNEGGPPPGFPGDRNAPPPAEILEKLHPPPLWHSGKK